MRTEVPAPRPGFARARSAGPKLAAWLGAALCLMTAAPWATAQEARDDSAGPGDAELSFVGGPSLRVEDRAELSLRLRPPPGGHAWMITLRGEGAALEVVRGRLLPSDAEPEEGGALSLRVPVVARQAGVAIVHAVFHGYVCDGGCREVTLEASARLRVASRRGG